jgi:hypothetical protein
MALRIRDEGLVATVDLGGDERNLTLTKRGATVSTLTSVAPARSTTIRLAINLPCIEQ